MKFWTTQARYLRQLGEEDPRYIDASPAHPALVELPDETKETKKLLRAKGDVVPPDCTDQRPGARPLERKQRVRVTPPA